MKGHDALVALRKGGKAPAIVFIETCVDRLKQHRDWQVVNPAMAALLVEPADRAATMDLRCVVGLTVVVDGDDAARLNGLHEACVSAGAKRVITNTCRINSRGDRVLIATNDSDGVLTWQT